jgi:hypothetical protein
MVVVTGALLAGCGTGSTSTGAPAAPTSAAAPTSGVPTSSAPASGTGEQVPPSVNSAALAYVGPKAVKPFKATKTVTGATLQLLVGDLNDLKSAAGTMECNVETGESATVTMSTGGHTLVYAVNGSPCRGVTVTKDGVSQPKLQGSSTLTEQIRAIAGLKGLAHPLTG